MMKDYEVLKKYFGYESFREGQQELITNILERHDVLGIMPTGFPHKKIISSIVSLSAFYHLQSLPPLFHFLVYPNPFQKYFNLIARASVQNGKSNPSEKLHDCWCNKRKNKRLVQW